MCTNIRYKDNKYVENIYNYQKIFSMKDVIYIKN